MTVAKQLEEQGVAYVRGNQGAGRYTITPTPFRDGVYTVDGPGIDRENYDDLDKALQIIHNITVTPTVRNFFQELTQLGWFDKIAEDLDPDYINGVCDLVNKQLED
jgi:hypothetical protein